MVQDLGRYHRQMLLPGFGEAGQRRLLESTALVLGCGALGGTVADLLARNGVGHLVLVDRDFVEITNLQRQLLYGERDVEENLPKAEAARRAIGRINSRIEVSAVVDDINHTNIERLAAGADVLVDGLDNFETRYLANDYAVRHGIPYVYGGAVATAGAAFAILPHTEDARSPWEDSSGGGATPCLRCLFEEIPPPDMNPTCDTVGVLAPAAAIVASFEAAEALKILSGNFDRVCRTMLSFDLWSNTFMHLDVAEAYEAGDCASCKGRLFEYLEGKLGSGATTLCGSEAVQLRPRLSGMQLDLEQIGARLRSHAGVNVNRYMVRAHLIDNGKSYELTVFADGRAIVKGTRDGAVARGVYARYVGA